MQLRATITIDYDPETFLEAGDEERELRKLESKLKEKYPFVDLVITTRRERKEKTKKGVNSRKKSMDAHPQA